jgi:hexosaminidase
MFVMKNLLLSCLFLLLLISGISQTNKMLIIPEPVEMKQGTGEFEITSKTSFYFSKLDANATAIIAAINKDFSKAAGFSFKAVQGEAVSKNSVQFKLLSSTDTAIGNEGYRLDVSSERIIISANKPAGLYYGMQTLLQLLPNEIESNQQVNNVKWTVPVVSIMDKPRFGWRGMMLDVSRHFFTKDEVKNFIDNMARYKYNMLHFHLTDDQGWRVEIKSLPKLTEVGAWNVKKTGDFYKLSQPADDEPRDYGGFYTQDDIREIVQYAKEHFVEVMPEVDIPGHSLAAVASYPDLSCSPGIKKVNSGETFMDWGREGAIARVDNTLCPANENVYVFLDKVFTELATLFPSQYIHMGGDECAKNFWEKSDQVKQLMQKEGLKDMNAVQAYFVSRVSKIITSKGKKMIGWDEILDGGLVPTATVMSWRGMKGGIEAAKMGHEVVMTPNDFVYVDFMQSDVAIEPPVYATLRLKKTFEYEPIPEGVDPKLIKGGQANLWTEQIYNERHLEYMLWPRGFAISEILWSPKGKKNWNQFISKVEDQFERFKYAARKFAPSIYDPLIKASKDAKGKLQVDFDPEITGLTIHYSFDNSYPDNYYPSYDGKPISFPVDATTLRLISYRDGKPIGRMISIGVDALNKRSGK